MRQDPPFDLGYITATHLLERIQSETLVVNDPAAVRNAPEKVLVMEFSDLMPPTLISRDLEEIKAFRAEHGERTGGGLHPIVGVDVVFDQDRNAVQWSARSPVLAFAIERGGAAARVIDSGSLGLLAGVSGSTRRPADAPPAPDAG